MNPKQTIYLAGPMLGYTNREMNGWREQVIDKLKSSYEFFNPTRRIYQLNNDSTIVNGDKDDINKSQIILVNHTKPSDGTAMEIIYSWERNKIILTVVHGEYSPWISYHSNYLFKSLEEAIQHLNTMRVEYEQNT